MREFCKNESRSVTKRAGVSPNLTSNPSLWLTWVCVPIAEPPPSIGLCIAAALDARYLWWLEDQSPALDRNHARVTPKDRLLPLDFTSELDCPCIQLHPQSLRHCSGSIHVLRPDSVALFYSLVPRGYLSTFLVCKSREKATTGRDELRS